MKPRLPRPKATWLLLLSHQFEWGCPLTTLRKITMFLEDSWVKMTSNWYDHKVSSRFIVSCFLKTHLIWRHLCSHTHPSPQVSSGLMGTDLVDPSEWLGGPIQSFWSYTSKINSWLITTCCTHLLQQHLISSTFPLTMWRFQRKLDITLVTPYGWASMYPTAILWSLESQKVTIDAPPAPCPLWLSWLSMKTSAFPLGMKPQPSPQFLRYN